MCVCVCVCVCVCIRINLWVLFYFFGSFNIHLVSLLIWLNLYNNDLGEFHLGEMNFLYDNVYSND